MHQGVRTVLTDRIIYLCLVFSGILFVIYPDLLTHGANIIGTGRGADLMLYILIIFSLFNHVILVLRTLPIGVAGVGVRDAVLIVVLDQPCHAPRLALGLSTLFLLLTIQHIIMGFVISLRYPLSRVSAPNTLEQVETPQ